MLHLGSAPGNHISNGCGAAQEYYANTGALKNAAETAQGGKRVGCSIVETFSKSTQPRELEEVLRLEYRSKLLNPKWAQVRCADQRSHAGSDSQPLNAGHPSNDATYMLGCAVL